MNRSKDTNSILLLQRDQQNIKICIQFCRYAVVSYSFPPLHKPYQMSWEPSISRQRQISEVCETTELTQYEKKQTIKKNKY